MPAVNDNVWAAQGTTPAAIEAALRDLLIERHNESDGYVPARVLNLVCVVERQWSGEIANRLRRVGRYHPSRTIVCAVSDGRSTIDAVASIAADATPSDGEHVLTHELVILDVGEGHLERLASIVDPLVITDLTTVVWAPHGHWSAVEALRELSQCVLLDSVEDPDVAGALRRAQRLLADRYVVDLAWLRSTPWRERIATLFNPPSRRGLLEEITSLRIRNVAESGASALLLCGWLSSRLGWGQGSLHRDGHGRALGSLGAVSVELESAQQDVPGLGGVTLGFRDSSALSLDRSDGGLLATQRDADGAEHSWKLLGASRGEGGILGEGIRQTLLRDPTYAESLDAAAGMLT
ncbi:MAG TPA: glucose-6-phosphate dehydrogenase assembly protein OpcA [Solirubrobacteraceae bacterium]|nr:glucose-6-phosphate dehydrogenase assembly protein OpcA [Solirubrobacteraceae bacterium]